jgi:hypothetical protein
LEDIGVDGRISLKLIMNGLNEFVSGYVKTTLEAVYGYNSISRGNNI